MAPDLECREASCLRQPMRAVHRTTVYSWIAPAQGERARDTVKGWTWANVALQYASLVTIGNATALGKDPFLAVHFAEPVATWHGQAMRLMSGHSGQLSGDEPPPGFRVCCAARGPGAVICQPSEPTPAPGAAPI